MLTVHMIDKMDTTFRMLDVKRYDNAGDMKSDLQQLKMLLL